MVLHQKILGLFRYLNFGVLCKFFNWNQLIRINYIFLVNLYILLLKTVTILNYVQCMILCELYAT